MTWAAWMTTSEEPGTTLVASAAAWPQTVRKVSEVQEVLQVILANSKNSHWGSTLLLLVAGTSSVLAVPASRLRQ